ncbi:Eukaryotic translation initiation factor 4E-2, putative [Perkinsus marinus ATCC 50983]|uniref:Eukaryotic translation initiation factor 4E-2, putative n=1 Tax=Perkinsus marinus (strain ATCC 50983 / TXsc) TaxID=423536 RepID=C5LC57_PERM5|nr:Eukaryotic translation initiation factor 4E-2, putative [Perkinsus marinus ATCC 50983]EER05540.1 Eukaryotic translation initiation factor 4E-2, putative [Perkinsus marinus ATCC 50983]|eukprot:XP_002773724.1 Eukaryotic translation initiation factor 4E-2, putative [Perkinsus marinus ATCC 50983]
MSSPAEAITKEKVSGEEVEEKREEKVDSSVVPEEKAAVVEGETAKSNGENSEENHKLQHEWSLWVMSQQGRSVKDHWQQNQQKAIDFGSIEEFWRISNNMHKPSKLVHADYSVFKSGVSPAWEDPMCTEGGRWIVKAEKQKVIDDIWTDVVLSVIGESYYPLINEDIVCGVVCSVRRGGVKIALWLSSREEKLVKPLGLRFKRIVQSLAPDDADRFTIGFEGFANPGDEMYTVDMNDHFESDHKVVDASTTKKGNAAQQRPATTTTTTEEEEEAKKEEGATTTPAEGSPSK